VGDVQGWGAGDVTLVRHISEEIAIFFRELIDGWDEFSWARGNIKASDV
jgi:hypothetical protein